MKRAPNSGRDPSALGQRVATVLSEHLTQKLAPGLYIVATPIGNLGDISLRALAVLARAKMVLAEDTRHSKKLLSHFAISAPELSPYHEHNAEKERPRILAKLKSGASVALISDAGTPLVSDPGYKLVEDARAQGYPVFSIPGPSALLAALTSAGLPSDRFFFEGFLPPKQGARRKRAEQLAAIPATLIFYEAPQRLAAALADMSETLGERRAAVARELTKLHEEVVQGSLAELASRYAREETRGEVVILVGPPDLQAQVSDDDIRAGLIRALQSQSLRDASRDVAQALGVNKNRAYKLALTLQAESE